MTVFEAQEIGIPITLTRGAYRRLSHLREAFAAQFPGTPLTNTGLIALLLDHLDQAIYRPGSWERGAFSPVFGSEVLDEAQRRMYAAGDQPG